MGKGVGPFLDFFQGFLRGRAFHGKRGGSGWKNSPPEKKKRGKKGFWRGVLRRWPLFFPRVFPPRVEKGVLPLFGGLLKPPFLVFGGLTPCVWGPRGILQPRGFFTHYFAGPLYIGEGGG